MNKEQLIERLSLATGVNAFTKEPVYDKLKLEAVVLIEELSEKVDQLTEHNNELAAKVKELEITLKLVQGEKLAASQGPKGHGYAYWKNRYAKAETKLKEIHQSLDDLSKLLVWNKLAKNKVEQIKEAAKFD